jgi:hypothetical protein
MRKKHVHDTCDECSVDFESDSSPFGYPPKLLPRQDLWLFSVFMGGVCDENVTKRALNIYTARKPHVFKNVILAAFGLGG